MKEARRPVSQASGAGAEAVRGAEARAGLASGRTRESAGAGAGGTLG